MASPAIKHAEIQSGKYSFTPTFRSLAELSASLDLAPVSNRPADGPDVSTSSGLKGAKAAILGIGLEAAAALCGYGIWQVWHMLR
jgi:hypothetical protein